MGNKAIVVSSSSAPNCARIGGHSESGAWKSLEPLGHLIPQGPIPLAPRVRDLSESKNPRPHAWWKNKRASEWSRSPAGSIEHIPKLGSSRFVALHKFWHKKTIKQTIKQVRPPPLVTTNLDYGGQKLVSHTCGRPLCQHQILGTKNTRSWAATGYLYGHRLLPHYFLEHPQCM